MRAPVVALPHPSTVLTGGLTLPAPAVSLSKPILLLDWLPSLSPSEQVWLVVVPPGALISLPPTEPYRAESPTIAPFTEKGLIHTWTKYV